MKGFHMPEIFVIDGYTSTHPNYRIAALPSKK